MRWRWQMQSRECAAALLAAYFRIGNRRPARYGWGSERHIDDGRRRSRRIHRYWIGFELFAPPALGGLIETAR